MPNAYDDLINQVPPATSSAPASGANAYADLMPQQPAAPPAAAPPSLWDQTKRGLGLSARALTQGAAGLPLMFEDTAYDAYRLATDPKFRSATWEQAKHPSQWLSTPADFPSQQVDRALDPYLPKPETAAERWASVPLAMEGGALMPQLPVPGARAPSEFVSPADLKSQRLADQLEKTQEAGLVVPPSTTNPTLTNKLLETVGGKEATQNQARVINQNARNELAAGDLGLKPEVFTPEAVAAVKSEAGNAIEAAKSIPRFQTSEAFGQKLDKVLEETRGANADFPGASNPDVEKLVDIYRQASFTGQSGVSAIKLLRSKADDAFRQGNSEMGRAYKGISQALEEELERGAQQAGGSYSDLVAALRGARKTYAQASTVEEAMDPAGNVLGPKLAAAWRRNEPLSGGLKLAAEHAANYPKANLPANSSNVSHLNMYGAPAISFLAEHATGSPWGLAAGATLPLARSGARSYLLSGMGQAGALPGKTSTTAALARALADPHLLAGGTNALRSSVEVPRTLAGAVNAP